MRAAGDETRRLQLGHGLSHRLRPDALGGRELARRLRPLPVEAREDGALRDREGVLGPQPAHELAEHEPELARDP